MEVTLGYSIATPLSFSLSVYLFSLGFSLNQSEIFPFFVPMFWIGFQLLTNSFRACHEKLGVRPVEALGQGQEEYGGTSGRAHMWLSSSMSLFGSEFNVRIIIFIL